MARIFTSSCGAATSPVVTHLGPQGVDDGFPNDSFGNVTALLFVREGGNAGWLLAAVGGDGAYPSIYVFERVRQPLGSHLQGRDNGANHSLDGQHPYIELGFRSWSSTRTTATTGPTPPPTASRTSSRTHCSLTDYKYAAEGVVKSMRLEAAAPVQIQGLSSPFRRTVKASTTMRRSRSRLPPSSMAASLTTPAERRQRSQRTAAPSGCMRTPMGTLNFPLMNNRGLRRSVFRLRRS